MDTEDQFLSGGNTFAVFIIKPLFASSCFLFCSSTKLDKFLQNSFFTCCMCVIFRRCKQNITLIGTNMIGGRPFWNVSPCVSWISRGEDSAKEERFNKTMTSNKQGTVNAFYRWIFLINTFVIVLSFVRLNLFFLQCCRKRMRILWKTLDY